MTTQPNLPASIATLVDRLADVSGVVAIVLGGSRADGSADASSDWDLGLYYAGGLDMAALGQLGDFHPPGSWGRIMNGGAWLTVDSMKVDVLLRDVAVLEHWSMAAAQGTFEIDALLGYLAGVPTYSLVAERSVAKVLRGTLAEPLAYPAALGEIGAERWRFHRRFSLDYARAHAKRGDALGAVGQAAKAVMEEAHARLCAQRQWVLNEKRLVQRAGLQTTQDLFGEIPSAVTDLVAWLERVDAALQTGT